MLLLRLLTGDTAGDAADLVLWVRGVVKYDMEGGGNGQTLAKLASTTTSTRGRQGQNDVLLWPPELALSLADVALKCACCTEQGGVPDLRCVRLPVVDGTRWAYFIGGFGMGPAQADSASAC